VSVNSFTRKQTIPGLVQKRRILGNKDNRRPTRIWFCRGKRRLNFANFITKERLNFPAVNRYRLDIMTLGDFMTGKLSAH
jgi:hypothetical protein